MHSELVVVCVGINTGSEQGELILYAKLVYSKYRLDDEWRCLRDVPERKAQGRLFRLPR